ncbi:MAG: SpoIID/LytB domain-containing protein [Fimbriimonadaceae bacterium]|nr:SpoIID/LytB domain-containing protein [Fimbriimonadaceae bacterium]
MRRLTLWCLGTALLFALCAAVIGNPAPTQSLQIAFRDSMTGLAVKPTTAIVRNRTTGKVVARGSGAAILTARLVLGTYEIVATSEDHGTMSSETTLSPNGPANLKFHMDPEEIPTKIASGTLRNEARPDAHLVVGYVADEASGEPLGGVRVLVPGGETSTEADGFFRAYVPVKPGLAIRFELPGHQSEEHRNLETWPGGDTLFRIALAKGRGERIVDEARLRDRAGGELADNSDCDSCTKQEGAYVPRGGGEDSMTGPALPKYIRVGRNCSSRTTCTIVEVYTLDRYVKGVLPAEWYSCWGNVAGGMDSLRAGAVAVRSYGVSFVYSPATSNYDICDTTACQVFGNTTTTNANNATDQTSGWVLLTSSGSVARSEYSAENNNNGCGDGWSGTGSTWPCISDPVCTGFADNGHGRGLCQWGSARWATGRRLSSSQSCTSSAPLHGYGTKNWQQILAHYYPNYALEQGGRATFVGFGADPSEVVVGQTTTFNEAIDANQPIIRVLLGASIAPSGSSNWSSNPAGDRRVDLPPGTSVQTRPFTVSSGQPWGMHDVLAALYYDRNNNFVIDSGDFVIEDGRFNNALRVRSPIAVSVSPIWAKLGRGQSKQFHAEVTGSSNTAVAWSVLMGPGTISANGLFTASSTAGGETVVQAASVADPTRTARAKIFTMMPWGGF